MTKYNLFQLIWQGYYSNLRLNESLDDVYMDDLSDWSYNEMAEYFDFLQSGDYVLSHKLAQDGRVYPVLFK